MRTPPSTATRLAVDSLTAGSSIAKRKASAAPGCMKACRAAAGAVVIAKLRDCRRPKPLMTTPAPIALHAVLAVELAEGSVPARLTLDRDVAETLAACVAADLVVLLPGFPVHAALEELAVRVPRTAAVVAFGSHDG